MALFPDQIYSIYMYTYIDYEDHRSSRIIVKAFLVNPLLLRVFRIFGYHMNLHMNNITYHIA